MAHTQMTAGHLIANTVYVSGTRSTPGGKQQNRISFLDRF